MAFPTSLDTFSNPTATDSQAVVDHAAQHSEANDAIEFIEAKVGINGSAVTTSHDFKLGEVTGTDKAVGKTANQTLTNKTLTSPKINVTSDATGDMYYRDSGGSLARMAIGSNTQILKSNGTTPEWTTDPTIANTPTTDEKAALAGTSGSPSVSNKYVTNADTTGTGSVVRTSKLPFIFSGDGSDGDININSGSFTSGPITSNALTRDAYFDNLTLSGGSLDTAGYRLFIRQKLTRSSSYKISFNATGTGGTGGTGSHFVFGAGSSPGGAAGAAGAARSNGTLWGGKAGVAGTVGADGTPNDSAGTNGTVGSNGLNNAKSLGRNVSAVSGAGGHGGKVADADGGTGGGASSATAAGSEPVMYPHNLTNATWGYDMDGGTLTIYASSNTGGGGGGGGSGESDSLANGISAAGGGGGGGGASAGVMAVFVDEIVDNGSGNLFECIGAAGGNGGVGGNGGTAQNGSLKGCGGGGGGGAGGNGGALILWYSRISVGTLTYSLAGGAGGTGGAKGSTNTTNATNGGNGSAGNTGTAYIHLVTI